MADEQGASASRGSRWWNALLAIPFVALLWVPIYNRIEPSIAGIPFFYWYQFLWVILTSIIILIVHRKTGGAEASGTRP